MLKSKIFIYQNDFDALRCLGISGDQDLTADRIRCFAVKTGTCFATRSAQKEMPRPGSCSVVAFPLHHSTMYKHCRRTGQARKTASYSGEHSCVTPPAHWLIDRASISYFRRFFYRCPEPPLKLRNTPPASQVWALRSVP